MPELLFDRDVLARWYADEHIKSDPGIRAVYYLPDNSPPCEIRLVEINELIAERSDEALEPFILGVNTGTESEHRLAVLDVTPSQWDRIASGLTPLPPGWTLQSRISIGQNGE
jgi:hypothetical protein